MKTNLLCQILECGYLDINFLDNLLDTYQIELDIDDIRSNFWKIDVNILIYETFEIIKNNFINDNQEKIESLWIDLNDIEYEIYTNYMCSSIYFLDERIQNLFERYEK